jgi:uncharacterized protein
MRLSGRPVRALAIALGLFALSSAPVGIARAAGFEVPPLRSAVTDLAGILSPRARNQLEAALQHLHKVGGTQLAVLTVPDLGGLTIEQASIRVTDVWKLGSADKDDGVLLMVAPNERRARIEVGQGLEGDLPDAYAKRIIDEGITPLFREGDFDGGVIVGVYQIAQRTNPDVDLKPYLEGSLHAPRTSHAQRPLGLWQGLFIAILMVFVLFSRLGFLPFLLGAGIGGMGRHRTGGFGGGGFGGGGFGGGGFSGGGGGFSGGGASGGW